MKSAHVQHRISTKSRERLFPIPLPPISLTRAWIEQVSSRLDSQRECGESIPARSTGAWSHPGWRGQGEACLPFQQLLFHYLPPHTLPSPHALPAGHATPRALSHGRPRSVSEQEPCASIAESRVRFPRETIQRFPELEGKITEAKNPACHSREFNGQQVVEKRF